MINLWIAFPIGLSAFLLRKLFWLLTKFIVFYTTLIIEKKSLIKYIYYHRIPRNVHEIFAKPGKFATFLKEKSVIPKESVFQDIQKCSAILSEPKKNDTSASVAVIYSYQGKEQNLKLFLKYQSGKGMALWMQALRAAAEPGVAREVDFYNNLASKVPVSTPKCYFAEKISHFNILIIGLEYIDLVCEQAGKSLEPSSNAFRVIPDHLVNSVDEVQLMLRKVAKMHAQYLGRVHQCIETRWIPSKTGIMFCDFILPLAGKQPSFFGRIFKKIQAYFTKKPITLVHGDCRPGNMIFRGKPARDVLFADWEATNIAPPMWDFVYCTVIGLPCELRHKHVDSLLTSYYSELSSSATVESLDVFRQDAELLTVVLFYLSYTVTVGGFWDNQGNTTEDRRAWLDRVVDAILGVSASRIGSWIEVSSSDIEDLQSFAKEWKTKLLGV